MSVLPKPESISTRRKILKRLADLDAGRLTIILDYLALRKRKIGSDEGVRLFRRDINTVLRDCGERGVMRRLRMPIDLHVDAARPLDHRIAAYRIFKRRGKEAGAIGAGGFHRGIKIGDEKAIALGTEGPGIGAS